MSTAAQAVVCRRIRVRGQVQGVGFRPFVYRLAGELGLAGWVRNDAEGVEIEAQGGMPGVLALIERLRGEAPPLARIAALETREAPVSDARGFVIEESRGGPANTAVVPDTAVCADCLAELFDPADRRWRYPFINCTHCGPRYTITRALPYDRPQTSMASFTQCPSCRAEYVAPADRRFHAQPNACPACGPRLTLRDATGATLACDDPVAGTISCLARGEIVAIKGLGGFHLACDARNAAAVARLRCRKNREEKPFALMLANLPSAEALAEISPDERALLESRERPVVLLRKRAGCDEALSGAPQGDFLRGAPQGDFLRGVPQGDFLRGVAPGLQWVGIMLPYAPLHYLLFHEAAGRPAGTAWLDAPQRLALVMTSANPGGEPIVRDNDEALARLAGIADAFLLHDRDIVTRCDDSVLRVSGSGAVGAGLPAISVAAIAAKAAPTAQFIRRARGYTPQAIRLGRPGPSVLALGGFLKNTVCLTRGDEAFVSQHIGDLDNAPTCRTLEETASRLMELLRIEPEIVAHDLHPDFHSTRYAADFARSRGLQAISVQHHHAHIAAVAAEHRIEGPLLGLALDGVGLGDDGGAWGGELLRVEAKRSCRLGHLRPLQLPGGDRAAREPWRMAAAALHLLGRGAQIEQRFAQPASGMVRQMLEAGVNAPRSSSCGRWFDAAAGLLGVRDVAAFEGQAAMLLEGMAERHGAIGPTQGGFVIGASGELDLSPLFERLAEETDAGRGAASFHATLAEALAEWAIGASRATGIRRVALGGGCFLNRILSAALRRRLEQQGLDVLEARQVPPNDGGLALGQAWVAMGTESE